MKRLTTPYAARKRRHLRVRKKVRGTDERPRLAVFRSLSHIYAQIIDDEAGRTLCAASDLEPEARAQRDGKRKTEVARIVGGIIGKRAVEHGIRQVVFDRAGYRFHGRVKELADGARDAGLIF